MNTLISLRSEILKTRRTASFYFTLTGAAAVPAIFLLNVCLDGLDDVRKDPFNRIFRLNAEMNNIMIFPLFVVLVCTLLPQIEYRNNTWKQVLTSPQAKFEVYTAKFLNIHLLILLFFVSNLLFMFLTVVAAHFIDPGLHLLNQPFNFTTVLTNAGNAYLACLALCTIQFWLGLRFRNFIIPIAIGIALWLAGTILTMEYHSPKAVYFPYAYHIYSIVTPFKPKLEQVIWTSLGYTIVVFGAGFLDFRRRRMSA